MRVTVVGAGTRGDVQPAAVIAAKLQQRGHEVVFAGSDDLLHLGTALHLESVPLGFDVRGFLSSADGAALLAKGDVRGAAQALLRYKAQHSSILRAGLLRATERAEVIVASNLMLNEVSAVAEFRERPIVGLHYAPRRPNGAHPPIGMAPGGRSPLVNRAAYGVVDRLEWQATAPYVEAFRRPLGLPRARGPLGARMRRAAVLEPQLYSRHLVPALADWSPSRPLLGFVTPDRYQREAWGETVTDPGLEAWLAQGDPPVYFGFGSMPITDPGRMLETIHQVAGRMGIRALVGAGWTGYAAPGGQPDDDDVRVVGDIDHAAILPRCIAAVHHGGAGTTAASITAGLPTGVCAVAFDQQFWGQRLTDLEVGTWIPFRSVTADSLERVVSVLLADRRAARARYLGSRLREEHAAEDLARLIEERVGRPTARRLA